MGTVPTKPKTDADPSTVESAVRSAIAGHPRGQVRRIVLWIVAYTGLVAAILLFPIPIPPLVGLALIVALIALMLLMLTDGLL